MSSLLRQLTEEEIQTSLSNGGSACSNYAALLPGYIAACTISSRYGGTSGCTEMRIASEYINAHCR